MDITFGEGTERFMVEPFGLEINDEGYVVDEDGELLKDGYGSPIKEENIGGVIDLKAHGFSINDEGIVVNHKKEPIAFTTEEGTGGKEDSIVPFIDEDGKETGLLRDDFPSISDYVMESITEENTDQKTL